MEFARNLSENCKIGGFVIGTCYDGSKIFNLLKDKKPNETIVKKNNTGEIIWKMTKRFDGNDIKPDVSSLGLEIDIYQESINKTHTEYIVLFDYFTKILDLYGFIPCPQENLERFGLEKAIGSFSDLFELMNNDIKKALELYKEGELTTKQIIEQTGISKSMFFRRLKTIQG